jgi:hypothetical protein
MNEIMNIVLLNLEKVGVGVALFLGAYLANILLGVWSNVKIEGYEFDWKLIAQSLVKFVVLGVGVGVLSVVVSVIPVYLTYIGIEIGAETMETIDSMVVIGAFATATIKYVTDALTKIKTILGG